MARQFDVVSSVYGAPLGRATWPNKPEDKHSVRLFRVHLDAGGYDDGGAYWGHGGPLYCATDDQSYREFTRAESRAHAAVKLNLPAYFLRAGMHDYNQLRALEEYGNATPETIELRKKLDRLGYGDKLSIIA